jgi:hypothetical protein
MIAAFRPHLRKTRDLVLAALLDHGEHPLLRLDSITS